MPNPPLEEVYAFIEANRELVVNDLGLWFHPAWWLSGDPDVFWANLCDKHQPELLALMQTQASQQEQAALAEFGAAVIAELTCGLEWDRDMLDRMADAAVMKGVGVDDLISFKSNLNRSERK